MADVTARKATGEDLWTLVALYRLLEAEMGPLSGLWSLSDGLPEPVEDSFASLLESESAFPVVGEIDRVTFGFLVAGVEPMLPQAGGRHLGVIRLVFVDHPAREIGVGAAMLDLTLAELRNRGIRDFDAHVLPGHRLVKNFFEAAGFSARSIVMSHADGG